MLHSGKVLPNDGIVTNTEAMSPVSHFSFEEIAFFRKDGTMDHGITELVAQPDDATFEGELFFLRSCRNMADIERSFSLHRNSKTIAKFLNAFFGSLLVNTVLFLDAFFSLGQALCESLHIAAQKNGNRTDS